MREDKLDPESEASFQKRVKETAEWFGWMTFSIRQSTIVSAKTGKRVSVVTKAGWPDVVLGKGARVLFREIKTDTGKVSPAQQKWGDLLLRAGCDWDVWRPRDWNEIERTLGAVSGG